MFAPQPQPFRPVVDEFGGRAELPRDVGGRGAMGDRVDHGGPGKQCRCGQIEGVVLFGLVVRAAILLHHSYSLPLDGMAVVEKNGPRVLGVIERHAHRRPLVAGIDTKMVDERPSQVVRARQTYEEDPFHFNRDSSHRAVARTCRDRSPDLPEACRQDHQMRPVVRRLRRRTAELRTLRPHPPIA